MAVIEKLTAELRRRWDLVWLATQRQCVDDANWSLTPLTCVLYALKCSVCVWLGLHANLYARDAIEVAHFDMASWESMDFMGLAYDFKVLAVQPGWRKWGYDVYETSTA